MSLRAARNDFETHKKIHESALLQFFGVDGFDVYNPSIPFESGAHRYLFGRLERRNEWSNSVTRLFRHRGGDDWELVQGPYFWPLEDPFVARIGDELVLGGTHVLFSQAKLQTYYCYFYRGRTSDQLRYFTTGPDYMKDIRLLALPDGKIAVFSRHRNEEIIRQYGCESQIGFTVIDSLDELNANVIEAAPFVDGFFDRGEWGGCNQAYWLDTGLIGLVGHKCYNTKVESSETIMTYVNVAWVFDPGSRKLLSETVIGTRNCYPKYPAKGPSLVDCAFTSGIAVRNDGLVDLYSGLGDTAAGRITIDNPFSASGSIAGNNFKSLERQI